MAKQKRKQAPAKPITEHQLFPAVVALWFGALFGLGSLAVRPSLLESLVRSSRIDLIVPAAAPPLGVTARMLMALILAAIGAAIGIAIARRLSRPKVEVRERKRGARSNDADSYRPRYAQAADASTQRPDPVYGQGGDSEAGSGVLAQRRRALTIEHVEEDFVPHDMAPLPGGVPQILDIVSMGIGPEPAVEPVEAPLDLSGFQPAQPAIQDFVPAANPVQLDWNQAPPVSAAAQPLPAASASPQQQFQPPVAAPAPAMPAGFAAPPAAPAEHHADDRQVFGMAPQHPPAEAPRQIFGQVISGDHVDPEFIRASGFKTSVFETEAHEPLFAPRAEAAEPAAVESVPVAVPAPAMPQAYEAPAAPSLPQFDLPAAAVAGPPVAPVETPVAFEPVAAPAAIEPAPQPPLPSPAGLGMTDLASRLAESMARRRAARSGQQYVAPVAEPAPQAAPEIAVEPAPAPVAAAAPQAFDPAPAPQPFQPAAEPAPAPIPQAFEPAPAQPAAFAVPIAAPVAEPAPAAPAAPAIPQAMRPLDLGGFEEDLQPLDSLLPPRHIAMPSTPPAPVPPFAAPVEAPAVAVVEPFEEADAADEGVAEGNYASLANIAPARNGFVRIDEPEADSAAPEPVVIFPGQAARPALAEEHGSFRRFDAPATAGQGQPIAAAQANPEVDREEADRALRSALANLQRMSGAA